MARVWNFSAGPSCLPEDVLKECAAEMMDCNGTGQSVMEMSHRSSAFEPIIQDAEAMVRKLMKVPENYKVLFVQGGGSTQFAMVAQNLGIKNKKAAYIETGVWAKKAAAEAKKLGIAVDVPAFMAWHNERGWRHGKRYVALDWQKAVRQPAPFLH